MVEAPRGGLTEASLLKAIKDLRTRGVRISIVPSRLTLNPAAMQVAQAYGLTVPELVEAIVTYRRAKNRVYMRNYMRRRRNSRKIKIKDAVTELPAEVLAEVVLKPDTPVVETIIETSHQNIESNLGPEPHDDDEDDEPEQSDNDDDDDTDDDEDY